MALLDKVPGDLKLYIGGYVIVASTWDAPIPSAPGVVHGPTLMRG